MVEKGIYPDVLGNNEAEKQRQSITLALAYGAGKEFQKILTNFQNGNEYQHFIDLFSDEAPKIEPLALVHFYSLPGNTALYNSINRLIPDELLQIPPGLNPLRGPQERIDSFGHILDRMLYIQINKFEVGADRMKIIPDSTEIGHNLYEYIDQTSEPIHQTLKTIFPEKADFMHYVMWMFHPNPQTYLNDQKDSIFPNYLKNHQLMYNLGFVIGELFTYSVVLNSPDLRFTNRKKITDALLSSANLESISSVYHWIVSERDRELKERLAEVKKQKEKYFPWSESFVVEQKMPTEKPSTHLKYSIQIPAYNEMPGAEHEVDYDSDDGLLISTYRGNMTELIGSLVASLDQAENVNPSEVEILVNVNNADEVTENGRAGTVGNQRTVDFLNAFKQVKNWSDEEFNDTIESLLDSFDWLPRRSHNPKLEQVRNYYRKIFLQARPLMQQGLQIHAIDCTDGMRITRFDHETLSRVKYESCFGQHRRLLGSIGQKRFSQARIQNESLSPEKQIVLPLDGDLIVARSFFETIFNRTQNTQGNELFVSPARFIDHIASLEKYSDQARKNLHTRSLEATRATVSGLQAIQKKWIVKEYPDRVKTMLSLSDKKEYITPWAGTYFYTQAIYEKSGGWIISESNLGEDVQLMSEIEAANAYVVWSDIAVVTQRDRISPDSVYGSESNLKDSYKLKTLPVISRDDLIDLLTSELGDHGFERFVNESFTEKSFAHVLLAALSKQEWEGEEARLIEWYTDPLQEKDDQELDPRLQTSEYERKFRMKIYNDNLDLAASIALGRLVRTVQFGIRHDKFPQLAKLFSEMKIFIGRGESL